MHDGLDEYMARIKEFEEKAADVTNSDLEAAYLELARSYRLLAKHREKSGLN